MLTAWVCRSGANEGVVERCMPGHGELSETECRSGRWYQTVRSGRELVPNRSLSPTRWYQSGQAHLRIGTKLPMSAHSLVPNRSHGPVHWYQTGSISPRTGTKSLTRECALVPSQLDHPSNWYQIVDAGTLVGTNRPDRHPLVPTTRMFEPRRGRNAKVGLKWGGVPDR